VKIGDLLSESAKGLGIRFTTVGILPTLFLFLLTLALLWSGAPGVRPKLGLVIQRLTALEASDAIALVLALLLFSFVMHPLQLSLVRLLEGYWGPSALAAAAARWRTSRHLERRRALERIVEKFTAEGGTQSAAAWSAYQDAAWRLRHLYPSDERVLPTALGNALRAGEDLPDSKYGLDATLVWPRLYPLLSERLTNVLEDQRNQLDFSVRMSAVFVLGGVISAAFLVRHGAWVLVPITLMALGWLSYRGAVSTALVYAEGIQSAFDLHRFDLLRSLHLPLPRDMNEEQETNRSLCAFLRQGFPYPMKYEHPPPAGGEKKET
jgi:hypothetical protein